MLFTTLAVWMISQYYPLNLGCNFCNLRDCFFLLAQLFYEELCQLYLSLSFADFDFAVDLKGRYNYFHTSWTQTQRQLLLTLPIFFCNCWRQQTTFYSPEEMPLFVSCWNICIIWVHVVSYWCSSSSCSSCSSSYSCSCFSFLYLLFDLLLLPLLPFSVSL